MGDPYQEKSFAENPYYRKRDIAGRLVVVLSGRLENRGLQLIVPISRAVQKNQVHELIVTDEAAAGPGRQVQKIAYLGFVEFSSGGVMVTGDEVFCAGRLLGEIAGFDETHLPNHLNIVLRSKERRDGRELKLDLDSEIVIKKRN
ncbi:MAG: hypothetical protein MJA84_02825 [Firmicutes bacterium]|nr:hypothetical protein [Bacillota bacterium]